MMLFFLDAYFFFYCRCASFLSVFFYALWCDIRCHSKTTLSNFWAFFDYLPTFSCKRSLWTTELNSYFLEFSGFFPLHAFLKKQQGDNCTHALNRSFWNEQFCPNSSCFFKWGIFKLKTNPFGNLLLIEVKILFGRLKTLFFFLFF